MIRVSTRAGIFLGTLFSVYVLFSVPSALAALLYFDPASTEMHRGDTVTLGLRIDTDEGECINTVDAVIHYDATIRAVDISRGDSILNIWVEEPIIDESNHTITFAGGIPGGYCGRIPGDPSLTNVIVDLVFRSPGLSVGGGSGSNARIWVDEQSQVLLHDGSGTNAPLRLQDSVVSLLSSVGNVPEDTWSDKVESDTELPSDFSITLTKDDIAFSGKYFIIFNSNDKQSGIDHYEVMEEPSIDRYAFKWGRADAPWVRAESPYVLKDQTLNSTILVRVFDKAGNERISRIVPDSALQSMTRNTLLTLGMVVGAGVLLIAGVVYVLWKRKQRMFEKNSESNVQ